MKNRVWGSIWIVLGIASITVGFLSAWDTIRSRSFAPTLPSLGLVAWMRHYDLRGEFLLILLGILLLLTSVTLFLLPKRRFVAISTEKASAEVSVPSDGKAPISAPQMSEPQITCYLRTRLVGSTFLNVDGTSRQRNLAATSVGDILICRTRTYRYAPDTVAVYTLDGKRVGQLDASFTRMLREQYPNHRIGVCVEALRGGGALPYICDLRVAVYRN